MNTNTNERKYITFNKANNYNINTNIVHNSKNISFPKIYINHNKLLMINYLITNNSMVKHIITKKIFI
jgi:glutaredoxin